jgi:tetratricopeptide (TPR) repeat protein
MVNMKAGYYNGRHYTTFIEEVEQLKRNEKLEDAERLLLELIKANEAENSVEKLGVSPWYYEQLAIIYRKQGNYQKEISILERYTKQKPPEHWSAQDVSQMPMRDPLFKRLEKAKILAGTS